ncbi:MAG: SapC family protein [Sulfurospirillaceae bacterium]|nr:SapC family protein [Sulfurospirillaceae bacterium]
MARKVRLFFEDTPQHILLRGNNQEQIFCDQADYDFGLDVLKVLTNHLLLKIHAYCLMPNHIHILCTPLNQDAISRFMQGFGIKYVSYFNKKYNRTGTLWEGRYRSSLVENAYVLPLMQYIESNPVRAGIVNLSEDYAFSSFVANALNENNECITHHTVYNLLASNAIERAMIYKARFHEPLSKEMLAFLREHIAKQTITGTQAFYQELSKRIGTSLMNNKVGRPKKMIQNNTIKRNSMYKNLVVLDKENHKSLKVSPMSNLLFAKELTSTPILANEIAHVGKDFPVVFTSGEQTGLVALNSLGGSNLAINAEGKYIVNYVPAFLRRYPFSIGSNKENPSQQLILIDSESEFVSQSKGKQLFNKEGENSETLNNAIVFLQNYEQERATTQNVINLIAQSGILEEREITVGEGDEKKILVNGFKVVSKEKLYALDDATLAEWVRKGIISFIDMHLNSLNHIQTLFNLASIKH